MHACKPPHTRTRIAILLIVSLRPFDTLGLVLQVSLCERIDGSMFIPSVLGQESLPFILQPPFPGAEATPSHKVGCLPRLLPAGEVWIRVTDLQDFHLPRFEPPHPGLTIEIRECLRCDRPGRSLLDGVRAGLMDVWMLVSGVELQTTDSGIPEGIPGKHP